MKQQSNVLLLILKLIHFSNNVEKEIYQNEDLCYNLKEEDMIETRRVNFLSAARPRTITERHQPVHYNI